MVSLDHLSDTQRRALILADNKIAENATWDQALLRDALAETWAITIFPEGTTTDGQSLLPFKPSLLAVLDPSGDLGGRVFFCNSGAEANEAAFKLAANLLFHFDAREKREARVLLSVELEEIQKKTPKPRKLGFEKAFVPLVILDPNFSRRLLNTKVENSRPLFRIENVAAVMVAVVELENFVYERALFQAAQIETLLLNLVFDPENAFRKSPERALLVKLQKRGRVMLERGLANAIVEIRQDQIRDPAGQAAWRSMAMACWDISFSIYLSSSW